MFFIPTITRPVTMTSPTLWKTKAKGLLRGEITCFSDYKEGVNAADSFIFHPIPKRYQLSNTFFCLKLFFIISTFVTITCVYVYVCVPIHSRACM